MSCGLVMRNGDGQITVGIPNPEYGTIRSYIQDIENLFEWRYLDFIKKGDIKEFTELIRPIRDVKGIWSNEHDEIIVMSLKKFLFAQECIEYAYNLIKDVSINEKYVKPPLDREILADLKFMYTETHFEGINIHAIFKKYEDMINNLEKGS